jgi:hypothetical protein
MNRTERLMLTLAMLASASPALAGAPRTPAPIAGIGIGAVLLVGVGYRALKSRINR